MNKFWNLSPLVAKNGSYVVEILHKMATIFQDDVCSNFCSVFLLDSFAVVYVTHFIVVSRGNLDPSRLGFASPNDDRNAGWGNLADRNVQRKMAKIGYQRETVDIMWFCICVNMWKQCKLKKSLSRNFNLRDARNYSIMPLLWFIFMSIATIWFISEVFDEKAAYLYL